MFSGVVADACKEFFQYFHAERVEEKIHIGTKRDRECRGIGLDNFNGIRRSK